MNAPVLQADSIAAEPSAEATEALYDEPESFQDELDRPADEQERAGRALRHALQACPDLEEDCPAREALWLVVQQEICTTSPRMVRPFGSTKPFLVTRDHATDELITAMTWLATHEDQARSLSPLDLFVRLRGVATKSGSGSARAAQSDYLHGVTQVPAGCTVTWGRLEEIDAA